ncbi:RimM RimM protein, required for 16S rRNA processing [Rhabdaerophilaceae bacterium]
MPPPERQLVVGLVGAPHGVRGELRVKSYTADPLAIGDYGPLYLPDGRPLDLVDGRALKDDMLVLQFRDITDRNSAQTLTGKPLVVDRKNLPETDGDDEFYHADLIGVAVEDEDGQPIGWVHEIHNYGAGDLLVITPDRGGGTLLVPFSKEAVPVLDIKSGRIGIVRAFLAGPEKPVEPET